MTKLFEFPDGTTIDLAKVWRVSPVLTRDGAFPATGIFYVSLSIRDAHSSTFFLTAYDSAEDRTAAFGVAAEIRARLIERWGADK